jgi:hypothetical protein
MTMTYHLDYKIIENKQRIKKKLTDNQKLDANKLLNWLSMFCLFMQKIIVINSKSNNKYFAKCGRIAVGCSKS